MSYSKNTAGSAEVLEENNYYPFGLNHTGGNGLNSSGFGSWQSYKYNGKELQETGMFDYGARFYMPDLGRWGVIDPLAETSRRFTPYNYALNNPISFIDPDGRKAMAPNEGALGIPKGGALEYLLGGGASQFGSFNEFLGEGNLLAKFGENTSGGGISGIPDNYDEVMAFLGLNTSSQNYFSGIDFSQYDDDPPGNKLSRFREKTANWVQDNIREPLSGWFDSNTRNTFTLDAAGQARMDDLRGQMGAYMRDNVGGGIRWGAEHGLVGSGMGTGLVRAYTRLDPNRLPFNSFSKMTDTELKGFQHAISRHGKEFGLKWSRKSLDQLVNKFNSSASQIRTEGRFAGYERVIYGERGSGKPNIVIKARTFELLKNGRPYYYYETLGGKFISAGLKTK